MSNKHCKMITKERLLNLSMQNDICIGILKTISIYLKYFAMDSKYYRESNKIFKNERFIE